MTIGAVVTRCQPRSREVEGAIADSIPLKIHRVWEPRAHYKKTNVKSQSSGEAWKFGDEVSAQILSSLSDWSPKLRGPFQNNPRLASKQEVKITKLN